MEGFEMNLSLEIEFALVLAIKEFITKEDLEI
jgi:hypothetical protein